MVDQIEENSHQPIALANDEQGAAPNASLLTNIASSPLPMIEEFSELHDITARNPNNLGALVALAVAYSQSGQLEAALRMYRRLLNRRSTSPGLTQVIAERLSDLEIEAIGSAHYHMVRGDLLMKMGRIREAVEEYNKII